MRSFHITKGILIFTEWYFKMVANLAFKIGIGLSAVNQVASGIQSNIAGGQAMDTAEANAKTIRESALTNERLRRMQTRKVIGKQIAEAGQGGSFTGSDIEVLAQSVIEDELQGDINLYNAEVNAIDVLNKGRVMKQQGRQGLVTGLLGAGATVAGGAYMAKQFANPPNPSSKFLDVRQADFLGFA